MIEFHLDGRSGVDGSGRPMAAIPAICAPSAVDPQATPGSGSLPVGLERCLDGYGIREAISYQLVSRYWPLKGIETGIFLALALALAGYCFPRLGRRRS